MDKTVETKAGKTVKKGGALSIQQMAIIGVMTAVTCVLSPFSLPIGPVPISLATLAIYFSVYVIGMKKGLISCLIYLLLGLVGVPVFSGFGSGPAKLFGPTGGYLIGYFFIVLIAGIFIDRYTDKIYLCLLGMVLGTAVLYLLGTAWLAYQAHMTFHAALAAGVIPFIPGDIAKMLIAALAGPQIRKQLVRAGLYN